MSDFILELKGISKSFGGIKALSGINLNIKRGEIHAICGENGAGKSTMMKILSGLYPHGTYEGQIFISGAEQRFKNTKESEEAGIGIIYQELTMAKNMNVCENIFLGNEILTNSKVIDWNKAYQKTAELLERVNLKVKPHTQVSDLGIGQQQLIEIAKVLNKKSNVILLDEPTAALTEQESDNLLTIMKGLRDQGVTCIFVSHKLREVIEICDSVTVIRDGKTVLDRTDNTPEHRITEDFIIASMVGRKLDNRYPLRPKYVQKEVLLEVKDLTVPHPDIPGRNLVDHVNFVLRRGEVLGVTGLMGAGRTEIMMTIFGVLGTGIKTGQVFVEGKEVKANTSQDAIAAGIAYVTEDRKGKGLILDFSIEENESLAALDRLVTPLGSIDKLKLYKEVIDYGTKMKVKTASYEQAIKNLSGGNQQKVVLAKWLMIRPKILILDEPTRGIDVGAKYEIYSIVNELIEQGLGIIMVSSELPEVLGMSDRVIVIHEGAKTGELLIDECNQERIMQYATGTHQH